MRRFLIKEYNAMSSEIKLITELLIKDEWGNPGSAIIVDKEKNTAAFVTEKGLIRRNIKNNKVQVEKVWYRLEKHLIHKA